MEDKNLTANSPERTIDKKICDTVLLKICHASVNEKNDRFDSKVFYKDNILDKHNISLPEFDKCLAELENRGYIKISSHYRQNVDGQFSIPTSFHIMEEGKKYCVILEESPKA